MSDGFLDGSDSKGASLASNFFFHSFISHIINFFLQFFKNWGFRNHDSICVYKVCSALFGKEELCGLRPQGQPLLWLCIHRQIIGRSEASSLRTRHGSPSRVNIWAKVHCCEPVRPAWDHAPHSTCSKASSVFCAPSRGALGFTWAHFSVLQSGKSCRLLEIQAPVHHPLVALPENTIEH